MAYNCHRSAIHDVIRQELAAMDVDYILAVGHSLGGIILVDLMAEEPNSKVGAVVTVGSQAALMYGLDAMVGLRYNSGRPFTPWLNVWDPLDLLSFEAHQVFQLRRGAENARPILDVQVDSCEAFPGSHNAYWNQEGTWAAMRLGLQYCVDRHREIPEGSTKGDDIVQLLKSRFARDVEFTIQTRRAQSQALTPLLAQHSVSLAQAALKQIEGKTAAMRQVERTNAQYYRLPFGNYAVVPGKIDTRCARKIIKVYASLRPRDWTPGHQWLGLIADHEALTDEAELILRSKGIGVYYRSRSA
jgi:pimeloyl-ACP methyl ester carboxylesterase